MSAKSCSMDCRSFLHPSIPEEEEDGGGDLYAELWQQILQLTSDQDNNPVGFTNQGPCPVAAPSPISCSDWRMNNRNVEPLPVWRVSPPRSGSGTGVFIPNIAATERGGRQGRADRRKKKAKKQVENK